MYAPGFEVAFTDAGTPRSSSLSTGQGFMVATAQRGPLGPTRVTSKARLDTLFGPRQSSSYLHDAAETAFNEGLRELWVARAVGAGAVAATLNLADSAPVTTLVAKAKYVGVYGNGATAGLTVQVRDNTDDATLIPSGSFQIRVRENGVLVEDSPVFVDKTAALLWAPDSEAYEAGKSTTIRLIDGAGVLDPVKIAATNLAGGSDGAAVTETESQTATDRFTIDLGPGQIAHPGMTTAAAHLRLIEHARTRNRHALLDLPDTAVVATIVASYVAAAAAPTNGGRHASAYWPWVRIPGLSGSGLRTVPPSAVLMGLLAQVDGLGNPNQAAAGELYGLTRWAVSLSQNPEALSETERTTLNAGGANLFRTFYGARGPVQFGNRTLRDSTTDPLWYQVSSSRTMMAAAALGQRTIRLYVHRQVDGKGITLGQLQSELTAGLLGLYEAGALYGETAEEAFSVDSTSDQVNPDEQLAAGLVKAVEQLRVSPAADRVRLELVRVSITEAVS